MPCLIFRMPFRNTIWGGDGWELEYELSLDDVDEDSKKLCFVLAGR